MIATVALTGTIATSAYADSYSGGSNHYDGKDPAATRCNLNASRIATRPIDEYGTGRTVATIEIFYSWSCHSNWIRVTNNPYGGPAVKFIESSLGGWNSEGDTGTGSSYSMMVYAPGTTHIDGYVYLSGPVSGDYYPFHASGNFSL